MGGCWDADECLGAEIIRGALHAAREAMRVDLQGTTASSCYKRLGDNEAINITGVRQNGDFGERCQDGSSERAAMSVPTNGDGFVCVEDHKKVPAA